MHPILDTQSPTLSREAIEEEKKISSEIGFLFSPILFIAHPCPILVLMLIIHPHPSFRFIQLLTDISFIFVFLKLLIIFPLAATPFNAFFF
jgi:hypothetical protein